jgi:DNA-binding response OmpR family regulator
VIDLQPELKLDWRKAMQRPKVLLVEDNMLLRWWMEGSLTREGLWVTAPETIEEALRLASAYPFDVLITDWQLAGGREGFEVLAEMRRHHPPQVAVLISAEADKSLVERGRRAGFDRVIQKPFPLAEIVAAVHDREPAMRDAVLA